MTRAWLGLLLAATVACESPDDLIVIAGRIEGPTSVVELQRDDSAQAGFSRACTTPKPFKTVTPDATGAYALELARVEVGSGTPGSNGCLRVHAAFTSGAKAWVDESRGYGARLDLPPLSDWKPGLALAADGTLTHAPANRDETGDCLGMQRLGPYDSPETNALIHLTRLTTPAGDVAWAERDATRLSPETLEDFGGLLSVEAAQLKCLKIQVGLPPRTWGQPALAVWESPERLPVQGNRIPVSRGAACPSTGSPCPLTDGTLTKVRLSARKVQLVLPADAVVRTVVLRGLLASLLTQVTVRAGGAERVVPVARSAYALDKEYSIYNADESLTLATEKFVRLELPTPLPAAHDFELELDVDFEQLTEVSLFE